MLLYHGSNTLCIAVLEPRLADHDSSCIYLTVNPVVAAFYLSNAVERPYYWFPYGYRKEDVMGYNEFSPNALQEAASILWKRTKNRFFLSRTTRMRN